MRKENEVIAHYIAEGVTASSKPRILSETKGSIVFKATLQDCHANRNSRLYPIKVLSEALSSANLSEQFSAGGVLCEANHPMNPGTGSAAVARLSEVDLTRVSHIVKEAKIVGDEIDGLVETAKTNCGRDLKGLIEQGFIPSFSMRGFGNVEAKRVGTGGAKISIIENCKIICWDWVGTPSHKAAKMTSIVESAQSIIIPVTRAETTDFLLEHSGYFNVFSEFLDADKIEDIQLSENSRFATVKTSNNTTALVKVEDVVRRKLFSMF